MRVLIVDNYDSFTFNLYQYVGEILSSLALPGFDVIVRRNDEISLADVTALAPSHIIISPGPGTPEDEAYFGVCGEIIVELGKTTPVMGVCLGMQGITYFFGGQIKRASVPMHGKVSAITHDGDGVYSGMPQNIDVMRYHSLMADPTKLPSCLKITSVVREAGKSFNSLEEAALSGCEVMGVRHRQYPIEGIQFHPESFATEGGQALLKNFLIRP